MGLNDGGSWRPGMFAVGGGGSPVRLTEEGWGFFVGVSCGFFC